jgi:hypothetical protein
MQPPSQAPRTPANGDDTSRTGARRSPTPSAQCENRSSHQTQYPRFHELVHALGVNYQTHTRSQAEVIVDTATLIILSGVGLDTSGETIPYVASWGETGALEAVTEHAQLIDRLARTVENAIARDTASDAAAGETVAGVA